MSKRLFAIMLAVTILVPLNASTAQAQTSHAILVDVPFAFSTNNNSLPAGTYRIEPASDGRILWTIRDGSSKPVGFLLAMNVVGNAASDLRMTFHRYGDKYFLAGFKTASYEISLPRSHQEKNLMAAGRAIPAHVINISAGLRGSR